MALSCAGDFFYLLLYIQTTEKKMTLIFHSKVNVAPKESRKIIISRLGYVKNSPKVAFFKEKNK